MENLIKQRVARRGDKRRQKNVLLVGIKLDDGTYSIGYSVRDPKDHPNKEFGEDMAVRRATSGRNLVIPEFVRMKDVMAFEQRCDRYFKGSECFIDIFEKELENR